MSALPDVVVLAFHPGDLAGLAAVALLWVGLRRYAKGRRRRNGQPSPRDGA